MPMAPETRDRILEYARSIQSFFGFWHHSRL